MEDKTSEVKVYPNDLLKHERDLRGWSFKDVADRIACPDVRLVRRWERGDVFPGSEYRQKLCQLFEKNAEELGLLKELYKKMPEKQQKKIPDLALAGESSVPHTMPVLIDNKVSNSSLQHSTKQLAHNTAKDANRQRMLERVRHFWIKGLLEHSLQNATLLALELHEEPHLVENPWQLVVQEAGAQASALPPGTSITQVYDSSNGELLILGEPGAGKTTLLLELASALLERATQEEAHPIPVVFNLSSWAVKRQPLSLWLVEELIMKYQVPRQIGQAWIEQDELLLLLDGLDEVDVAAREECIVTLNSYRETHGLVPLVICCRKAEYLNQKTNLLLHSAIIVQPLTPQQIDAYLHNGGEKLARLHEVLTADSELQDLVKTPLMLSIFILTSQGEHADDLNFQGTLQEKRDHLFHMYVKRMFQRRGSQKPYTQEQTQVWLSWLAKHMKWHDQTVFYIDALQSDWLTQKSDGGRALLFGLLIGICCGISYGIFFWRKFGVSEGLLKGGLFGFLALILYIVVNGPLLLWLERQQKHRQSSRETSQVWRRIQNGLISCAESRLAYGLFFGLPFGLTNCLLMGSVYGSIYGLTFGLYSTFIITLDFILLGKLPAVIQPAEVVVWSWKNLQRRSGQCLGGGIILCLVLWLFFLPDFNILQALLMGLLFGGSFMCTFAVAVAGLSHEALDKQCHITPNQGIHRSVRNSLFLGGMNASIAGLFVGLIFMLFGYSLDAMVVYGVISALSTFLITGLRTGGYAWIQHVLLRIFLWKAHNAPLNYPDFLDFAVERILLRRVGGGYIFIHRILLDYFAGLDLSSCRDVPANKAHIRQIRKSQKFPIGSVLRKL
jgi:transcriptional regulator with XRE-family HTH domain